tara:strand:- start:1505 stop:2167 length:663 start_codon:yes stop_codon:yes gene_type:complete
MVLKIGHRGAAGYEPENTIRSFKKALKLNVDMIELDVHLSKDKELIVIHDKKVNRTTNGKGFVHRKTLKELKSLRIGKEEIPTLEEVINLINKKALIIIELKGKNTAIPVSKLIKKYLRKGYGINNFHVSSFSKKELKKLDKDIKSSPIVRRIPLRFNKIIKHSIYTNYKYVTKRAINRAHKKGIRVNVYTVNSIKDIKRMKALNVDGIVSNYPDKLSKV